MDLFGAGIKILTILIPFLLTITIFVWTKRDALKKILIPKKTTLIQLIEDNPSINRIIKEVLDVIGAHRVGLYFSSNYEEGMYVVEGSESGIKIIATNEVKLNEISSIMNVLKEVEMFLMNSYIEGIIDNNGVLIMDKKNTPKSEEIIKQAQISGVKSAVWHGINRKSENRNAKEYLIGAIIVSFIKNEHHFTREQLSVIAAKCESIAYIVENLYLKHFK